MVSKRSVWGLIAVLAVGGCDGRPLLYQWVPSELDKQVLALFDRIDTAHAGQITRAQADAYVKQQFATLDRNHDGFLDEAEAQGAVPVMGMKSGADMIFRLDINGDGKLSVDEFQRLSNYLFTRDANRDGVLTLVEAKLPPSDNYVEGGGGIKPGMVTAVPAGGQP